MSAAKVVRTEAACRRVEDLALRFARHLPEITPVRDCLERAEREINAILRDLKFEAESSLIPDNEGHARQITLAAAHLVEALARFVDAAKPRKQKSHDRNAHAGPRRPPRRA